MCFRKGGTQSSGEAKIERLDGLKAKFWLFSTIEVVISPIHQELLVLGAKANRYSTSSGEGRKTVLPTLVGHRHTLVLDKHRSGPKYLSNSP